MRGFTTGVFLISLLLLFPDVYGSNTKLQTYLHISSSFVAFIATVLLVYLRLFSKQFIEPFFAKVNAYAFFPFTLIVSISLTIWGFVSPPNFIFAHTHLQYTQLFMIALFSGVVLLLTQKNRWFEKYYKDLIFLGVLIFFAIGLIVWMFSFETFRVLSQEDGVIENLQYMTLLLASLWSMIIAARFYKRKNVIACVLFFLTALALFFVAGEEISWGQRLFHLQTPEAIYKNNTQGELIVHNMKAVNGFVGFGYLFIGAFGSIAWILPKLLPSLRKAAYKFFIPPWFVSGYFLFGFIYNFFIYMNNKNHWIGHWSEFAELMLYMGVMFTLFYWSRKV